MLVPFIYFIQWVLFLYAKSESFSFSFFVVLIGSKGSNVEFVEVVRANYRGGPRPKSYITFMAREKPDGPLVEYQAKGMATLDRKKHPILCRPAPMPKPQNQN